MPIGFVTSPHLSKTMNNGTKTNKGSKDTALPQAGKKHLFHKNFTYDSKSNQTNTKSKIRIAMDNDKSVSTNVQSSNLQDDMAYEAIT